MDDIIAQVQVEETIEFQMEPLMLPDYEPFYWEPNAQPFWTEDYLVNDG